jgi:hypothetical protein
MQQMAAHCAAICCYPDKDQDVGKLPKKSPTER